jgi:hypothetical protein
MRIPRAAAIALLALALVGCTPDDPTPTSSPSDTVKPTQSVTPEPEQTTEAPVEPVGLSAADYENLHDSIASGNTAALEQYLSNPVTFIIAASECCGPVTPLEAISGLDYISAAVGPWAEPSAAQLTQYRAGYYVDYFPEGAYVIQSSDADPYVVSFEITGDTVTGVFIGGGASLLYP